MKLVLIRHARRADYTIGRLEDENGMKICDSLEPTWRDYKAAIERQGQDLQELQARLGSELDAETAKYNQALRDSLQNFLRDYNKSKKYDMILSKSGDNILLASKRFDITQDVINGLNKRYKSTFKESDKK